MKTYPKIGDKLYLSQNTGNSWVDMVKDPYTVIGVEKSKVIIQSAKCNFPEARYFDTLPLSIEEDKTGQIVELTWHAKREKWGTKGRDSDYPSYAYFGEWRYQPYLN